MCEEVNPNRQVEHSACYTWAALCLQVEGSMTEVEMRLRRACLSSLPLSSLCLFLPLAQSDKVREIRGKEAETGTRVYFTLCEHGSESGLQVNVLMDGATRTLSLFTGMFKPSETS